MKKIIMVGFYLMLVSNSTLTQQTDIDPQLFLTTGLAIKQNLNSPSIKQKIKELAIVIIKEAHLSPNQLKTLYQTFTQLLRGMKVMSSTLFQTNTLSYEDKPEYKKLKKEAELFKKKFNESRTKNDTLIQQKKLMQAQKEYDKKSKDLLDTLFQKIALIYPDYAAIQKQIDQATQETNKWAEKVNTAYKKLNKFVQTSPQASPKEAPEGKDLIRRAIDQWPFDKIVGENKRDHDTFFTHTMIEIITPVIEGIQEYLDSQTTTKTVKEAP
ncbi:MAG: hypothetical protein WBQ73_00015 [Candidatus Babeliales bacterium]